MTAKILGLAKLRRKLDRMPGAAKDLIQKAMAEVADDIVATMKRLVPVEHGALRNSIGWTWGEAPKGASIVATARGKIGGDLRITFFAGSHDKSLGPDDAFYARWVEFGTQKMRAQPFFYVSFRAHRRSAKAKIGRAVAKAARLVADQ